jgi:hypothetical protein
MGMACSTHGEKRNAYRILLRKPKRIRPLGRPRRRWENNIKMVLRDIGWGVMGWIYLAEDRDQWRAHVKKVMNLLVLLNSGKFWSCYATGGFPRRAQLHGVS